MKKETKHWLLVLGLPYVIFGIITLGSGFFLLPLGGTIGVLVGLLSSEPYFTINFKLGVFSMLLVLLMLGYIGFRFRQNLWAKILISLSIHLWCLTGIVGFGPQ